MSPFLPLYWLIRDGFLETTTLPMEGIKKARTTGYTCATGLGAKTSGLMLTGSAPLSRPLDVSREVSIINIACLDVNIKMSSTRYLSKIWWVNLQKGHKTEMSLRPTVNLADPGT
jgi:hypothetical protein